MVVNTPQTKDQGIDIVVGVQLEDAEVTVEVEGVTGSTDLQTEKNIVIMKKQSKKNQKLMKNQEDQTAIEVEAVVEEDAVEGVGEVVVEEEAVDHITVVGREVKDLVTSTLHRMKVAEMKIKNTKGKNVMMPVVVEEEVDVVPEDSDVDQDDLHHRVQVTKETDRIVVKIDQSVLIVVKTDQNVVMIVLTDVMIDQTVVMIDPIDETTVKTKTVEMAKASVGIVDLDTVEDLDVRATRSRKVVKK